MLVLWGAGAWFILKDQFDTTSFRVSPGQITGTATAIVLLVLLALTRRPDPAPRTGQVPAPWVVAVVSGPLVTESRLGGTACRRSGRR